MTATPRRARNSLHLFAGMVRKGEYVLTDQDREDLLACEIWAKALRKGLSLDVGDIGSKIYEKESV